MIARDEGRIKCFHCLSACGGFKPFSSQTRSPPRYPTVVGSGVREQGPHVGVSVLIRGGVAQPTESQCEVRGVFMHRSEKGVGELEIAFFVAEESELVSYASEPMLLKAGGKRGDRLIRKFDRQLRVGIQEGNQGLGEPGKIPLRNAWLIAIGVAPRFIDRAEGGRGIVRIHERARSKINGFS